MYSCAVPLGRTKVLFFREFLELDAFARVVGGNQA
jgi:hypothetical protein